jgi:hypothetical protein
VTSLTVGSSTESGLKWPNFVNGRLLTAQDLESTREAVLTRDGWLGLAIGAGVVTGLVVTGAKGSTALKVSPGVGVNRAGTALRLAVNATLDLVSISHGAAPDGSQFADCRPPAASAKAPAAGVYLLSVSPQTWYDGKVPVEGVATGLPAPCVSRWEVEGVAFKATRLDQFTAASTPANRRNLLAHWCFGSDRLGPLAMGGFASTDPHRGLDRLPAADLSPCDLPLAVFDWTGRTLSFVDLWSARRRTVRPAAAALPEVVGDDRTADGEARFLQFQDQLAALLADAGGTKVTAQDVFPQLPPAGMLPVNATSALMMLKALFDAEGKKVTSGIVIPDTAKDETGKFSRTEIDAFGGVPGDLGLFTTATTMLAAQIEGLRAEVEQLRRLIGVVRPGQPSIERRHRRVKRIVRLMELLAVSNAQGFDPAKFFTGVGARLGVVSQETVDFTIRRSWLDEPIRVGGPGRVTLSFVLDENERTVAPYMLFAKSVLGPRWIFTTAEPLTK